MAPAWNVGPHPAHNPVRRISPSRCFDNMCAYNPSPAHWPIPGCHFPCLDCNLRYAPVFSKPGLPFFESMLPAYTKYKKLLPARSLQKPITVANSTYYSDDAHLPLLWRRLSDLGQPLGTAHNTCTSLRLHQSNASETKQIFVASCKYVKNFKAPCSNLFCTSFRYYFFSVLLLFFTF